MKKAYPVFIKEDGGEYLVFAPDMQIYTQGADLCSAIEMARDAIGIQGLSLEDRNIGLPNESTIEEALEKARDLTDEEIAFAEGILTFVDVDFKVYRNRMENRSVKKNCTLPYWLNEKAEKTGINFSRVLQEALIAELK